MFAWDPDDSSKAGTAIGGGAAVVVVGGTGLAAAHTANAGPVLAFGAAVLAFIGAVLGAWIAASTARQRQRAELGAARTRQRAELEAEERRLAVRLDHERALSEVAHLRDLLDAAANLWEQAFDAFLDLVFMVEHSDELSEQWDERYNVAGTAQLRVVEMHRRLQLRFPNNHPVVTTYGRIRQALYDSIMALPKAEDFDPENRPDIEPLVEAVRESFQPFCDAGRELIAPDLT